MPRKKLQCRTTKFFVCVTPEEKKEVQQRALRVSLTPSAYIRGSILGDKSGPTEDADLRTDRMKERDRLLQAMGRIGNNLNLLAHAANISGKIKKEEELTQALEELNAIVPQIAELK